MAELMRDGTAICRPGPLRHADSKSRMAAGLYPRLMPGGGAASQQLRCVRTSAAWHDSMG
jgi:hypothetical protein